MNASIERRLIFVGLAVIITICYVALSSQLDGLDQATIGGTNVPTVQCAEDEVIWWTGTDTLGCVHFEEVN